MAVGIRGGCEAVGYADTDRSQISDHLAQRRVLAADLVEIGKAQVGEPDDCRCSRGGDVVDDAGTVLPSGISGLVVERLQDHCGHLLHGLGRGIDHRKAVVSVHGLSLAQFVGALL